MGSRMKPVARKPHLAMPACVSECLPAPRMDEGGAAQAVRRGLWGHLVLHKVGGRKRGPPLAERVDG